MPNAYKHEDDPPPQVGIDLYANAPTPTTPLPGPRFYRVEWATDPALFANAAARTASNFFPLGTAGISQSALRQFSVPLDPAVWTQLKKARQLFWRVGLGTTQTMATWTWSMPRDYQINHDPTAEAGAPQRVQLASGGITTAAVSLDGSGSDDPDPGSMLTPAWSLKSPPPGCFDHAFISGLTARLTPGTASVTPFPAGTTIPDHCKGTWTFELEVTDNDPPSIVYATKGHDNAETAITLGSCIGGIRIDRPTAAQPERRTRPNSTQVEIAWSMDPVLAQQLASSYAGHHVELTVQRAGSPLPAYVEVEFLPGMSGAFSWSGDLPNGSPAPAGSYDITVAIVDPLGQPVTITGFASSATETAAIAIDRIEARIDRVLSDEYVFLPAPSARFSYEMHAPFTPDAVNLNVFPAAGGSAVATLTLPTTVPASGTVTWNTSAVPPGEYIAQIEIKHGGAIVFFGNHHELHLLYDPLPDGPFPVGEHEYNDGFVTIFKLGDGYTFAMHPDRRALVRYPAVSAGRDQQVNGLAQRYPLVLITHGNHRPKLPGGAWVQSFRGFEYLARKLATHGLIAVSIDMDELNGPFDPSIATRGQLVLEHVALWQTKNAAGAGLFAGKVDLTRIGLVGHSRGGEAVVWARANASQSVATAIRGVVALAPTNVLRVLSAGCPFLTVYGSVDGDMMEAAAFELFDNAQSPKCQVFVRGANHNNFVDHADWQAERMGDARMLAPATHLSVVKAFTNAFLHWTLFDRAEDLHFLNGDIVPPSIAGIGFDCCSALAPSGPVDSFSAPPHVIELTDAFRTVAASPPGGLSPFEERSFSFARGPVPLGPAGNPIADPALVTDTPYFQQRTRAALLGWTGSADYLVDLGSFDARSYRVITFRVAQAFSAVTPPADARNPAGFAKDMVVTLVDSGGSSASVSLAGVGRRVPYPYVRNDGPVPPETLWTAAYAVASTKSAFMSARLPLWAFMAMQPNLDLAALASLRLGFAPQGLIALDDIEFSV